MRVTAIEPAGESKMRITVELIIDVHRLAEVGSDMLQAAVKRVKTEGRKKN